MVWAELRTLADAGRLKTIRMVRDELERNDPDGHRRILGLGRKAQTPAATRRVIVAYRSVTLQFPIVRAHWERDPADPWLVAYAEVYGYTIITDEIPAALHVSARNQRRLYLPDICIRRTPNVPTVGLRALAVELGWLPA